MANAIYPAFKTLALTTGTNLLTADIKAALVKSAYSYSASHDFLDDLSTNVIGSTDYLSGKTVTTGTFDAADAQIASATTGHTGGSVVLYVDTGSSATSRLIAYLDTDITGLPVSTNGGDINLVWDADGIFTI